MTAGVVLAAVAAGMDRGAPLTARDLLKFDQNIVRRLFDDEQLIKIDLKRGRAVQTVIVVKPTDPVDDQEWTDEELGYLRLAYAGGVSFTEMERKLKRSGGEILQRAWRLKLERGARDRFNEIPAWRIARLRALLEEAYHRGLNERDSGEGLEHRAMQRYFKAGRADLATRDRKYHPWTDREVEQLRQLRDEGASTTAIARSMRRTLFGTATKISELELSVDTTWREDEDRIVVAGVERGLNNREIAKLLPGRSFLAVKMRARRLCGKRGGELWTEQERQLLREAFARGDNLIEFARSIGRSKYSVRWQSNYLGLQGKHPKAVRPFTETEDRRIREGCARREPFKEIAADLGRTLRGVYSRAFKLGVMGGYYKGRITADEIQFVREKVALDWSGAQISKKLGRTQHMVYSIAKKNGIRWERRGPRRKGNT